MNPTPKAEIQVRRLTEKDTEGLVACFERCYGRTYPSEDFYSVERLKNRIREGTLRSVVAIAIPLTEQGPGQQKVVGHTGLTVRQPSGATGQTHQARAAIAGNTVVDPDFRGQGVLKRLGAALQELTTDEGFVGYVHYPTTAHTIMQKRSVESGGVETGLQLAFVPDTTDYRAIEDPAAGTRGRLGVTVVYQPFDRAPLRKVYLPERYAARLTGLFAAANLKRLRRSSDGRRPSLSSRLSLAIDPRRSLLRIDVEQIGSDLAEQIDALLQTYPPGPPSEQSPAIVHADLYLDDPGLDTAVEILRSRGFFYCGLLPELAHTDVLRLQRLHSIAPNTDPFDVLLFNAGAQQLLSELERESQHP